MNFFASVLLLFFTYIMQTTVADYLKLWGVKPDILLTVVLCYAIFEGKEKGVVMGLCAGLLLDFLWGRAFGVNTILFILLALLCAITADNVFHKNAMLAVLSVFIFSFVYGVLFAAVSFAFSGRGGMFYLLWRVAIPSAIYNTVLAIPVFALLGKLRVRFGGEKF